MDELESPKESPRKTGEAVPYQRVYDRDALAKRLDITQLEENHDVNAIITFLNSVSKSRSPDSLQITLIPEPQNKEGLSGIFNAPTLSIRQPKKDIIYQTIPGYIKIDFDGDGKLLTLEFSNATLHDAIFNPAQMLNEFTPTVEKLQFAADYGQMGFDKKNRGSPIMLELKKFSQPTKEEKELAEFDKDKERNIQTLLPFETESAIREYYCQALQSFLDTLLDAKLTGLSLGSKTAAKLYIENKSVRLRIEFNTIVISETSGKKYPLLGQLMLEYRFTAEKGFQFQFIASNNAALIGFFVGVAHAPSATKTHLPESMINTFIHEPAKTISTEAELLHVMKTDPTDLTETLKDIKTSKEIKGKSIIQKDKERRLKLDKKISEEDISIIEKFYAQHMLALPNFLCAPASSQNLVLTAQNEKTSQNMLIERGRIVLRVTLENPTFTVRNPYDPTDADHKTFSGKITVEYAFNKEDGFTFTGMTFSNNVLYNLIVNAPVLFPREEQDEDPALAKAFNATIKTLQEAAKKQETPQPDAGLSPKKK